MHALKTLVCLASGLSAVAAGPLPAGAAGETSVPAATMSSEAEYSLTTTLTRVVESPPAKAPGRWYADHTTSEAEHSLTATLTRDAEPSLLAELASSMSAAGAIIPERVESSPATSSVDRTPACTTYDLANRSAMPTPVAVAVAAAEKLVEMASQTPAASSSASVDPTLANVAVAAQVAAHVAVAAQVASMMVDHGEPANTTARPSPDGRWHSSLQSATPAAEAYEAVEMLPAVGMAYKEALQRLAAAAQLGEAATATNTPFDGAESHQADPLFGHPRRACATEAVPTTLQIPRKVI